MKVWGLAWEYVLGCSISGLASALNNKLISFDVM